MNSTLIEMAKIADRFSLPESVRQIIETQNKFKALLPKIDIPTYNFPKFDITEFKPFLNSELLENLRRIGNIGERLKNNPELQFGFITDLEILNLKSAEEFKESLVSDLTDEDIKAKEEILSENLVPYLKELGLENIWYGANFALENDSNPDRLRHCLISLRTILEHLIDDILAPVEKLKNAEMFEKEFRKYKIGKQKLIHIRITREQKIEFFTSQIKFGMLDDFTKNEIKYVCDCYSILCNVHQPNVGITENQVRSLKVKTGITIWLLVYMNEIINE
ncbi:hypothetical protein [Cytophaga aurantiaca]|uniref:pPIWI-associating nuclease domain-containing protein n=1 Tax=Cytophaga aurantiaca TaxID=29530 RepID=UPI00039B064D|nr:hypothetical protein [Cytophaga aurantiaca]